jgi:hypothetical protein
MDELKERRKLLLALVKNDGWDWYTDKREAKN